MKTQAEAYFELQTLSEEFAALIAAGIDPERETVAKVAKRMEEIQRQYFKPSPFMVGKSYPLMNGETIIIVAVTSRGTEYECIRDQHGHHRYSTRDFGRSTGTDAMDYDRFIDLSKVNMTGFEYPYWWQLMNKEVVNFMSNDDYEAFSEGLTVEKLRSIKIKIFERIGDEFLVEFADRNYDWSRREKFWLPRDQVVFEGGSSAQKRRKAA